MRLQEYDAYFQNHPRLILSNSMSVDCTHYYFPSVRTILGEVVSANKRSYLLRCEAAKNGDVKVEVGESIQNLNPVGDLEGLLEWLRCHLIEPERVETQPISSNRLLDENLVSCEI